jgi:hypothetical protein
MRRSVWTHCTSITQAVRDIAVRPRPQAGYGRGLAEAYVHLTKIVHPKTDTPQQNGGRILNIGDRRQTLEITNWRP